MKKNIVVFGIVLLFLGLIITPTINGSSIQFKSESEQEKETDNNIYVDPDIKLTESDLKNLRKTYNKIDDYKLKTVIKSIIQELEKDENVDSEDLKIIIKDLGINNISAFCGRLIGRSRSNYNSYVRGFPMLPYPFGVWNYDARFWIGYNTYIRWGVGNKLNFTINNNQINYGHKGVAVSTFGIWTSYVTIPPDGIGSHDIKINMFSPLILLSKNV